MAGAASWHPSVIGHRVRAAHHSYIWLNIFKDALEEVLRSKRALDAQLKDVQHHLDHNYKPYPPKAAYDTKFVDDFTCNTDYEPRHVPEASLKAQVISGLKEEGYKESGWKFIIYENLVDKVLVERSHQNGYLDFKYLIYADDTTDDLHLKMSIKKDGPVSLHFHGKVL
jgi:hypothetical protein